MRWLHGLMGISEGEFLNPESISDTLKCPATWNAFNWGEGMPNKNIQKLMRHFLVHRVGSNRIWAILSLVQPRRGGDSAGWWLIAWHEEFHFQYHDIIMFCLSKPSLRRNAQLFTCTVQICFTYGKHVAEIDLNHFWGQKSTTGITCSGVLSWRCNQTYITLYRPKAEYDQSSK